MHKSPRLLLLALCALLLLPASPALAGLDEEKSRALSLAEQRRYDEAYEAYMALLRQEPEDFEINLMLARSARMIGRLNHARVAYERVIEAMPDEAGLYLELADLLTLLGANEEARQNLEKARLLDPDLEESQLAFIAKGVEQRTANFSHVGRIGGGFIYDSNINAAPDRSAINLGGTPLTLRSKDLAEEALGVFLNAGLDLAWRPDVDSDWWLVADVAAYQRWNFDASPRRDISYGRGSLGLRHFSGSHLFEVRGKVETILENEKNSLSIYGGELIWVASLTANLHNIARVGLEYRHDYNVEMRNGTYYFVSEQLRWFFGQDGHNLTGGVKVYGADARTAQYRYSGVEPSLQASFVLPADFTLITGAAWRYEAYDAPGTGMERRDRQDKQWRLSAFLDKKVTESLHVYVGWQYVDNDSESDVYSYDQHQVTTGVMFTF